MNVIIIMRYAGGTKKPQSFMGCMYSWEMPLLVLHWKLRVKLIMKWNQFVGLMR